MCICFVLAIVCTACHVNLLLCKSCSVGITVQKCFINLFGCSQLLPGDTVLCCTSLSLLDHECFVHICHSQCWCQVEMLGAMPINLVRSRTSAMQNQSNISREEALAPKMQRNLHRWCLAHLVCQKESPVTSLYQLRGLVQLCFNAQFCSSRVLVLRHLAC